MKLNAKLILISLVIVLITIGASSTIYYSLTERLFTRFKSQLILNSTNDFIFLFENYLQQNEYDIKRIINNSNSVDIDSLGIDFLFTLKDNSIIDLQSFKSKKKYKLDLSRLDFKEFINNNPRIVLGYLNSQDNFYYYGMIIDSDFLTKISEKIRSEIAFVVNNKVMEVSNPLKNESIVNYLEQAIDNLKYKNNYDIFSIESDEIDFSASIYTPTQIVIPSGKFSFLTFDTFEEGVNFRNTLKNVVILVIVSGGAFTFIIVLIFTYKFRKQISILDEAAEITARGDLNHRARIITKDEIGKLGQAFNKMLDVINEKEKTEREYTEFIKLINKNPSLDEICDAALNKIIKTTQISFGIIYVIDKNKLITGASYGIEGNSIEKPEAYLKQTIDKKEIIELTFEENHPVIRTGLSSIKIRYLLLYPIIYNNKTVAVLELASEKLPASDIKLYLNNIQEQLAVGLVNARSLQQLENLVGELRRLNEEYQLQNKELKQLHLELKAKAEELEEERKKAVELYNIKSRFLANMSHELRTPLISILGLTELMLKEINSEKSSRKLKVILRNGKKLLRLINNILDFSKVDAGKLELNKERFLLSDLIEDIIQDVEQMAAEKKLKFILELPKNIDFMVEADRSKLEQILSNLLFNAFKFTEEGYVRLKVEQMDETSLAFAVEDTGVGITEENKEKIFEEFGRIETNTSRKYGGAGLGLSIAKHFLELMGSKIELESKAGEGSRFSFLLNNIIIETFDSEVETFQTKDSDLKKCAVIITSNQNTYKLIADYLASYNYEVMELKTENLSDPKTKQKPDVFIIGNIDDRGREWETLYKLKTGMYANTPVIILTVLEDQKVGWIPNIYDFVVKPVSRQRLEKLINDVESYLGNKAETIFWVDKKKEIYDSLKSESLSNFEYRSGLEAAMSAIDFNSTQIFLIDVESFVADAILFTAMIRHNVFTRNTMIILILPERYDSMNAEELTRVMNSIALREKNHPLDILKVIRDRIKIDNEFLKEKLIETDETPKPAEETVVKKNKPTVLIVDDDQDTLFTIGEFVKQLGCNAIFAHNGMECLLTLNHVEPDLIFLDIMMPMMDGFETIKKIRTENRTASIPVIALTAYAMLENKEVIEKNGFDDLVTKPVEFSLLAAKIKNILQGKSV
ncbi:response regulator [Melioribacter sp. OK-6-Me]|uniref:response regulator n=1 Tax=unclassified Melioribacter TaxID=2627329 RepID=UPI003EDA85AB